MSDPVQAVSFRIDGMDCAEEVAVLKRAVGPLVGGEENLSFEVLNGKMTVLDTAPAIPIDTIARAISKTGMGARPWRSSAASGGATRRALRDRTSSAS